MRPALRPPRRSTPALIGAVLLLAALVLAVATIGTSIVQAFDHQPTPSHTVEPPGAAQTQQLLAELEVADPDPDPGYDRGALFGQDWAPAGQCDTRALVLARDLTDVTYSHRTPCLVTGGTLTDPYTGTVLTYQPGTGRIEVDHIVSLYNAWTSGAQDWDQRTRIAFANDTTNLLAVSATANQDKRGADAAAWTPADPTAWCGYAIVQISVKHTYQLSVTAAEKNALTHLLHTCQENPS